MNNRLRGAAVAAFLTFGAARARAQITTVIGGPKRADAAAQQQAARVERAAQDSVARTTLTGMTQWVDSAAASLALRPDTGTTPPPDTAATPAPTTRSARMDSASSNRTDGGRADLRNGARAPNTATPLPTIALVGAVMILLGLVMRRRTDGARARVQR